MESTRQRGRGALRRIALLPALGLMVVAGCGGNDETDPEVKIGVLKRLTTGGGDYPQWSPDGGSIIYAHEDSVFTIGAAGGNRALIATVPGGDIFHPHFNKANPAQVCFLNRNSDRWEIQVATIGEDPVVIYSQQKQISSVSFTRDGTEIAFTKDPGSTGGVWLIPPGGGSATNWPRQDRWGLVADAECAMDADLISFIEVDPGQAYNLFALPRTGGAAQKLSGFTTGTDFTQAARSWDGSKYCIRWGQRIWYGTDFNLYILNPSSGEVEQVTAMSRPFDPDNPAWSPDGTRIAFSRQPSVGEPTDLFIVDLSK